MQRCARTLAFLACGVLAGACGGSPSSPVGEVPETQGLRGQASARLAPLVLTHAGQGSPAKWSDGAAVAADRGAKALSEGALALEAAMLAVESMEDDPRFNAGIGANLRMDGSTIQADAAVMDGELGFGAVAGIRGIRHPVRVAEQVARSPHKLMVGAGAQAFADGLGLERAELSTPRAKDKLDRGMKRLAEGKTPYGWDDFDWRKHWNYEGDPASPASEGKAGDTKLPEGDTKDTVGAVVRGADGRYAAALSTGGTTLAMRGRVGDVPQLGAGLYAGPAGAVAATGRGESIIRERVAAEVYALLAAGVEPNQAIRRVTRHISAAEGVGVIAVSDLGWGAVATSQMAWALVDGDVRTRADGVIWH